ncbi:MAG: hypothetical protein HKN10_11640, partial [Myxococcales bacterium]|nr:hypothetical protein [Myxococcales bacterium]
MSESNPSRVIDRLLRQDEEGLKMYLVCRLGGAEELPRLYGELRGALGRGGSADLAHAPSLKSLAYATARRLALATAPELAKEAFASLEWMRTPERESPAYGELLDRIRLGLDSPTAEILELRYARALTEDEIGYVIGRRPSEVNSAIASGTQWVLELARSFGSVDPDVELLVRDSFRPLTSADSSGYVPGRAQALRLAPGAIVGGRFEIQSSLETGSVTSSYLAGDMNMPGQSVILRVFHDPTSAVSARMGLVKKLTLVDSVDHPSVEHTLAHGWHQDRLWYATPWYRGQPLRELVERRGLSPLEAVEIFGPIAR